MKREEKSDAYVIYINGTSNAISFSLLSTRLNSIFLVPKKDSGYRPAINLKHLNLHVPYVHFEMESLSTGIGTSCANTGPERCIFFSSSTSVISGENTVPMAGKDLPVSLSLFRSRTSTKSFYKYFESSDSSNETTKCKNDNILGRHTC